ncbi:type II toxin-antitoxin system HicA family toxin [Hymenobacter sp. PAMC 26628]|uniref:type II toxin-antitoxin system HicA family toxin n=1 Tax=Hymenobacter sp. PAMC 26628 TaxID=1484118 RepID=UPI0007705999|nr:type II toxin-antitoxin system HicA family toxin [Hymenobacter sp. PAMC 26628]AMJ64925.1 hypothetical protein AXW84_05425 [Hymenobacter sp. PAMC 26628]
MKRLELVKHILVNGCIILREGGNHTALFNPTNQRQTILARHREIDNNMARIICKQLGIPPMR